MEEEQLQLEEEPAMDKEWNQFQESGSEIDDQNSPDNQNESEDDDVEVLGGDDADLALQQQKFNENFEKE